MTILFVWRCQLWDETSLRLVNVIDFSKTRNACMISVTNLIVEGRRSINICQLTWPKIHEALHLLQTSYLVFPNLHVYVSGVDSVLLGMSLPHAAR
jgi:hypothetical protein